MPAGVELVELHAGASSSAADVVVVLTDHDAFDRDLLGRYGEKVLDPGNRLAAPGVGRL